MPNLSQGERNFFLPGPLNIEAHHREATSFSIEEGGAKVTLFLAVDDYGYLAIKDESGEVCLRVDAKLDDWNLTENEDHWHNQDSAFLPEGTYSISGEITNVDMAPYNDNNLFYCRYRVDAFYSVPDSSSSSSSSSSSCLSMWSSNFTGRQPLAYGFFSLIIKSIRSSLRHLLSNCVQQIANSNTVGE